MLLKKSPAKASNKKSDKTDSSSKQLKPKTSVSSSDFPAPVRKYWEGVDWVSLSDVFEDRTVQRGREYVNDGSVLSLWATKDGKQLLSIVCCSYDYRTLVTLDKGSSKNQFVLSTTCSCPVGSNCKHGVATILSFLNLIADNESIPLCRELDDDKTWEIIAKNGKPKTMKIDTHEYYDDEDEYEDDEEEDDEEEDDEYLSKSSETSRQSVSAKSEPKEEKFSVLLKKKLKSKSPKELVTLILQFCKDYEVVRDHFKREMFTESVVGEGDIVKLVEKAIKIINKEMRNLSRGYGYYNDYYDIDSSFDLQPVIKIVRQFKKFDNILDAVDRVAKYLLENVEQYYQETGAEEACEFEDVFKEIAVLLIASKESPVSIILWVYDIFDIDEFCTCESIFVKNIIDRNWSIEVWSEVADALLNKKYKNVAENRRYRKLRAIVDVLDKAHRQEEATNLLRADAVRVGEQDTFVKRLIKFGLLDEAEKFASEQHRINFEKTSSESYDRNYWSSYLKEIADKKQDWAAKASIEAMEFFKSPSDQNILELLLTAKKMNIESAVRRAIETFLQTGKLPAAVQKYLEKVQPTTKDCEEWRIPFFAFRLNMSEISPRFDVLCEWAIAEKRPNDVVYWFDEIAKQKPGKGKYEVSLEEVADAIMKSHPERAIKIYLYLAEHEMEATRNYPSAIRLLRKARNTFTNAKRTADWQKTLTEIRITHRRKPSLMKQLDQLESGSIVNQKRKNK
ncbi:MAG: hypothetical protein LBL39_08275 [Planctomycetaceae bacterium]|jgi:uncharacterized Zn finger protein|nr:hypothetical protein [Planctomycetaceae bacterium]